MTTNYFILGVCFFVIYLLFKGFKSVYKKSKDNPAYKKRGKHTDAYIYLSIVSFVVVVITIGLLVDTINNNPMKFKENNNTEVASTKTDKPIINLRNDQSCNNFLYGSWEFLQSEGGNTYRYKIQFTHDYKYRLWWMSNDVGKYTYTDTPDEEGSYSLSTAISRKHWLGTNKETRQVILHVGNDTDTQTLRYRSMGGLQLTDTDFRYGYAGGLYTLDKK